MKIKGEELKKIIWRRDQTILGFCEAEGFNPQYVYQACKRNAMNLRFFYKIAKALDMTEEELSALIEEKE